MLVNRTRIKEICGKINVSQEFVDELDKYVEESIKRSCKRAVDNKRTTVMARDI